MKITHVEGLIPAKIKKKPRPAFPRSAKGLTGTATVWVQVDQSGIGNAVRLPELEDEEIGQALSKAAQNARFEAASIACKMVEMWLPVEYELPGGGGV